jgi:hypothetical protein
MFTAKPNKFFCPCECKTPSGKPKFCRTLGALLTHMKKEHPRVRVGIKVEEEVKYPFLIDDDWA